MIRKLLLLFLFIFCTSLSAQEDCNFAIMVCGNSNINYTPSGIGNINEDVGGCLSGEHHSVWYKFTIATSGTLTFNLVPTGPVDYDWAIYGPNASCNNLGSPIRCNASGALTSTGMNMTNNNTVSAGGNTDPYCRYMDVVAGQTYYLYLDNWSTTVYTFNLTWGGTATFVSPFNNSTAAPNPFIPPGTPGPGVNSPREIGICGATALFDFSSLSTGILNGNPNFTVTYFNSANNAATGANPITTPTNVNTTTTYYYNINYHDPNSSGSTINACKQTNAIVFKNKSLTASITPSATVLCPAGSIILTSNNATGNTWSTGATTPTITVTTPGTYTLTSTNRVCTSSPASITITQDTDPSVDIAGNLVLCESTASQLTASSNGTGNTYTWSTGTTGNTISVTTPGTYTVTVKTPANCQYTKSVTVTQGVIPVVQNSSLSQCSNSTTGLFDLTSAQPSISTTANITFDYYLNQADALAGNTNTISTPAAYTSGNATIYVRVKSGTCFKIVQLQLNITQSITPTITPSSPTICYGGNVILTSSITTGNTWSTGATTASITITTPGTYTLTNTIGSCTSTPASVTINQENNPNVEITGNLLLCDSPSTQLTASSAGTGNTYTWSTGTTGNTVSVTAPGTYTVTVKTPANCEYTKSVTVTQGVVPTIQNSSLSQCSNSATAVFNLTSSQQGISTMTALSFDYYVNQADALAGNANTIPNPTAYTSGNTTVYVRVKSSTCFKVAQLQLSVTQFPVPTITASSSTICYGGSVTLTSSNATGNTWSTGATTPSITITTPGTYTLTGSNGLCASTPASVTILSETNPTINISGNLTFCQGASTTLTASAQGTGNTFVWSNSVNGAVNTVNVPGTYTVTITKPSGCQYQKSATVVMDAAIIVNIAPPAQITCTNSQITLNATASIYQPGSTFAWTASNGGVIVSGANTLTPTVNNSGTYTLTITSATPFGCSNQASVTVIKNTTPPTLSVSAPKLTICMGESVLLTATGAATYTWTGLPGNGNTQMVSPTTTTTYTVTGTGANGCTALTPATITIKVVPEIVSALHDIEICKGDKSILDAGAGPNYTYLWSTGATTRTINVELAGTYSVTISNGVCSKTFTATVNYIVTPEILSIVYKDPTLTINIKNSGNLPAEYSIDGGLTWQSSNVFTNVLRNTQYPVKVRNRGALCETNATYYTFFMSNVITPNSDGKNDVINFSEISKYGNFQGSIFDKYGKEVFKISTKTPIWNGRYLDRPLPSDTYWYRLFWEDRVSKKPVEISGWVLLKNRD
ncbi:gliding motility-associated C-terminal domain-containing protein [Chryseobacterium oleae]|uniref:Gliding motility-associated C-terminal domain-containing protein n=1 Tax=Chryseobacterium oleae TaxID=491207 RepID=A0A1I5A6H1_CHROL|nr:T9SS type B sorting domain-containing protein [Chryseobacterium oleae]SFN57998.1 gliding motility-associated C-terminal domain-containing protein [Chryseobacterium oleae]